MSRSRPKLVFISPLFLFPKDAGGKIRTANILGGMKDGAFEIVLVMPATSDQVSIWMPEIQEICDELVIWKPSPPRRKWRRAMDLFARLPVNVISDCTPAALLAVSTIAERDDIDLLVFDFVHCASMRPPSVRLPSICFTHNVEAEIFARHAERSTDILWRKIWASQYMKMKSFEGKMLHTFDAVIAVSEKDIVTFKKEYGITQSHAIPTGVDLDYFSYQPPSAITPAQPPTVIFTGSMDWAANIDGIKFFLKDVWPKVILALPDARVLIVGRNPSSNLQALGKVLKNVEFTGFVDDIRRFVYSAHTFVIPLLVGGGTRIKAFEAMAMGCPVVSTSIGIEGLDVQEDIHFMQRDDSLSMAAAIVDLLNDEGLRHRLSLNARQLVEQQFGHAVASAAFEQICADTLSRCGWCRTNDEV